MQLNDDRLYMLTRSKVALGTLVLMVGLIYFGQFLPSTRAGLLSEHPHASIECQTCHKIGSNQGAFGDADGRAQNCRDCHSDVYEKDSPFHSVDLSGQCSKCHSFHKPELVRAAGDTMSLAFAVRAVPICQDCHRKAGNMPEVSQGHREAAALIHSQRSESFAEAPSEFCLSCHDADRSQSLRNSSALSAPRFHVGASHVFGAVLVPGSGKPGSALRIQDEIPQHLRLFDQKMECQTCHSLNSKHEYLLSQRIEDGLCTSCHNMNRESNSSPIFTVNPQ